MKTALLLILATACTSSATDDYIKNRKKDDVSAIERKQAEATPPPPKRKVLSAAELGNCHLTASGAVAADQTTPGGRAATNVSYWYAPDEQKTLMGIDGFVVTCKGDGVAFQIVPGGGKPDAMPFKPKTYTFDAGKGDANLIIAFGKQAMTKLTGKVDITAFDAHHIAGTIDLAGKVGNADEKLAGNFDLTCPGLSACE